MNRQATRYTIIASTMQQGALAAQILGMHLREVRFARRQGDLHGRDPRTFILVSPILNNYDWEHLDVRDLALYMARRAGITLPRVST